jgi:5-methylcytosine-specific restriction endonuclease McrA
MELVGNLPAHVLRRDRYTCQACGIAARAVLAVHHIVPVELDGKDVLSNLVALCAN